MLAGRQTTWGLWAMDLPHCPRGPGEMEGWPWLGESVGQGMGETAGQERGDNKQLGEQEAKGGKRRRGQQEAGRGLTPVVSPLVGFILRTAGSHRGSLSKRRSLSLQWLVPEKGGVLQPWSALRPLAPM